jgi:hypothetical protein
MKKHVFASVAVMAISVALATEAGAQVVVERVAPAVVVDPGLRLFSYSYYAAAPYPPREYVGYGINDFPYYGRPYGSPSDRWSWPIMAYPSYGALAHYYYPPVR